MNKNRLINSASDSVIRFRSSQFPLKKIAQDIIKIKKLNSSERKILLDLIFAFSREYYLIYDFLSQKIRFFASAPKNKQDLLILEFLAHKLGIFLDEKLDVFVKEYKSSPKNYLKALGFIGEVLEKDYGEQAKIIAEGLFLRPKKYLAFDKSLSLEQVTDALKKKNINYKPHPYLAHVLGVDEINLKDFKEASHMWLMDAGSQIIAEFLSVKSTDQVLDMCAGEGGKALLITKKDCHYVAMDIDESRLKIAKSRIKKNIEFINHDACTIDFKDRKFDWILLDAPCSGSGVIRRNPDLVFRLNKEDLSNYIEIQRKLLDKAVLLLKPGGILIYATCSLFKAENEEQISRILRKNTEIMPIQLKRLVGDRLKIEGDLLVNNSLILYPHINDCDGFFIAALEKGVQN
jgi:16S rRNA C967 or C1407 C5-methylase (RsmB/RsmF family)